MCPPLTGAQMARAMRRCINLGGTFEMKLRSRAPQRTHALLKSYKDKGFQSVRIPVTWDLTIQGASRLQDATFMQQLDGAINYAIAQGLIVLINCHHEHWWNEHYTGSKEQNDAFWAHWRALAAHYKDIPQDKLVFQILNEPQGKAFGASKDNVSPDSRDCIARTRLINKTGYDGVRFVDKTRVVAVMPNNMGNVWRLGPCFPTLETLVGPVNDDYLLVTSHSYDAFTFAGQDGSDREYTSQAHPYSALRADIDKRASMIAKWRSAMPANVGFVLTECGIGRRRTSDLNTGIVREYMRHTATSMLNIGAGVALWTDGGWFYTHDEPTATGYVRYVYGLVDAFLGRY